MKAKKEKFDVVFVIMKVMTFIGQLIIIVIALLLFWYIGIPIIKWIINNGLRGILKIIGSIFRIIFKAIWCGRGC